MSQTQVNGIRESERLVDGVQRCPLNGIKATIIGAGVGGLLTALECWRKGCEVVVLERADSISAIGKFLL